MKKLNLCAVITSCLFVAACATAPQITQKDISKTEPEVMQTPELPATPFAIDTLYDLLVGDIALTRSQFDIALPKYMQQARQTRDSAIVEMASRVASHLRNNEASTEMALLWVEVEPDSPKSHSAALQAYAMQGDAINALPHASWLYQRYDDLEAFLAVTSIYEGPSAKAITEEEESTQIVELISAYQQLELPQEKQPTILLATAILHRDNAQLDLAEQVAKAFLLAAPDNQRGLLLLAQVLHQLDRIDEAVLLIEDTLTRKPDDRKLRLQYARFLTITDRNQAIVQFKALHDQNPNDQEINFLLALLQLNQGEEQQAAVLFKQAASKPSLSADAHYHLGGIVDRQGDVAAALGHYRQVRFGRNYLAAASRVTILLAQHNNVTSARQYLQRLRIEQPEQSVGLFQIESNLLISANQPDQALSILTDGLDAFPNDAQLLYARSMVAEQQDNFALAEQDLRTLIEQNQNNATALNALGYTMILHTDRHEEAYALIKRAYLLNPGDPATIDSLGWVLFKMGELDRALAHLTKAIGIMPDPEIAAHLGEVQWSLGDTDSAIKTWTKGLQQAPRHKTIVTTMQRLGAELSSLQSENAESQL
jgi:tetratricopeptide (TPR) repeat protein